MVSSSLNNCFVWVSAKNYLSRNLCGSGDKARSLYFALLLFCCSKLVSICSGNLLKIFSIFQIENCEGCIMIYILLRYSSCVKSMPCTVSCMAYMAEGLLQNLTPQPCPLPPTCW